MSIEIWADLQLGEMQIQAKPSSLLRFGVRLEWCTSRSSEDSIPRDCDKHVSVHFQSCNTNCSTPRLDEEGCDFRMDGISHQQAFEAIKKLITDEVTLAYFNPQEEVVLEVDASSRGFGAALTQKGRPIAFASKSLTDTETRYANIEREMLAVIYACEKFHTFVYGKPFKVLSDHKPLEMIHLKNLGAAPPRLQRMMLRLQGYRRHVQVPLPSQQDAPPRLRHLGTQLNTPSIRNAPTPSTPQTIRSNLPLMTLKQS